MYDIILEVLLLLSRSYCCYYRYYWRTVTRRRCRTKWTGRRCNIR